MSTKSRVDKELTEYFSLKVETNLPLMYLLQELHYTKCEVLSYQDRLTLERHYILNVHVGGDFFETPIMITESFDLKPSVFMLDEYTINGYIDEFVDALEDQLLRDNNHFFSDVKKHINKKIKSIEFLEGCEDDRE